MNRRAGFVRVALNVSIVQDGKSKPLANAIYQDDVPDFDIDTISDVLGVLMRDAESRIGTIIVIDMKNRGVW